jgi:RNA polymerase sigma-54 factor
MKQSLQLRTSQHLALTPQLQQSIRLLQLSTLELHQELETLLIENPLLERVDDPLDSAVRLLADGAISASANQSESEFGPPAEQDAGPSSSSDSVENTEIAAPSERRRMVV